MDQAIITLNLLQGSCLNPHLSAWAYFHGNFDFNCMSIAPPVIRVVTHHEKAMLTVKQWSPHGLDGWYIGPALKSYYRCFTVWIWDTQHEHICDTLSWFPTKVTMPLATYTPCNTMAF
jgi:hypothetical protein